MIPAPLPPNEEERLAALQRYQVLDTVGEAIYDDLTRLASHICGTPMAMISLVDQDRQWFKSRIGLEASETPREIAFCGHAILETNTFVVPDATRDERFADNPLVQGDPRVRFYAGVPLTNQDGFNLGTLCVVDPSPHSLSPPQQSALEALGRQVITLLEFRRTSAELANTLNKVKTLSGLLPICAHCKSVRDDQGYWNQVESYVSQHSHASFSHGICPACLQKHYGEYLNKPES